MDLTAVVVCGTRKLDLPFWVNSALSVIRWYWSWTMVDLIRLFVFPLVEATLRFYVDLAGSFAFRSSFHVLSDP